MLEPDPENGIMWFPWSEVDKFGVIKSELTGKAYHKCQISRKCFGKIFASILRFMISLRPGTEERNTQINITWFPSPEIDKTGGSNFLGGVRLISSVKT